jgi:hypothetical protein
LLEALFARAIHGLDAFRALLLTSEASNQPGPDSVTDAPHTREIDTTRLASNSCSRVLKSLATLSTLCQSLGRWRRLRRATRTTKASVASLTSLLERPLLRRQRSTAATTAIKGRPRPQQSTLQLRLSLPQVSRRTATSCG